MVEEEVVGKAHLYGIEEAEGVGGAAGEEDGGEEGFVSPLATVDGEAGIEGVGGVDGDRGEEGFSGCLPEAELEGGGQSV